MEREKNLHGRHLTVMSMVMVMFWTMIPIVSAVPLYDSVHVSSSIIGQGQPWILNGSAPGYTGIQVWIFGPGKVVFFKQGIQPDGSYTISLLPEKTRDMTPGTYHTVLQFPDEQGVYDIMVKDRQVIDTKKPASQEQIFSLTPKPGTPISPFAYAGLLQALDDPAVNDTYADTTFSIIQAPSTESAIIEPITIDPVDDHMAGDQFITGGTTTLSAGDEILVQIMSSSFVPGPELPDGMLGGTTGTVHVVGNGSGKNTWHFPVETTHWLAGEYLVSASAVNGNATASDVFTVYRGSVTIDPISNHTVGDSFTITGTSELSENDPLYVQLLYRPPVLTKEISLREPSCGDSGSRVTSINRTSQKYWSYRINTRGCSPGPYRVEAFSGSGQVRGDARQFEIYPDATREGNGWFVVHSDAEGAVVEFNGERKGTIHEGVLTVPVNITGKKYTSFLVFKLGYVSFPVSIDRYPLAGETIDLYPALTVPSTAPQPAPLSLTFTLTASGIIGAGFVMKKKWMR